VECHEVRMRGPINPSSAHCCAARIASRWSRRNVCSGSLADIEIVGPHDRFTPKSGRPQRRHQRQIMFGSEASKCRDWSLVKKVETNEAPEKSRQQISR